VPGPADPAPRARTLRQRVDDHPAALFVGIALAAATATLGIVIPLAQLTQDSRVASVQAELAQARSEHQLTVDGLRAQLDQAQRDAVGALDAERAKGQARIDELERSLSGITRTIGDGTDIYDVSDLVVEARDASSIPDTSLFHTTDRFYALDPDKASGWTYEETTELGIISTLWGLGEDAVKAQLTPPQVDALTRFPVHAWYYGDDKRIELDDPVGGTRESLHPRTMALVQHASQQEVADFQLMRLTSGTEAARDLVRSGFGRDPAGWVLQDQVVAEYQSFGAFRPRIESLQKRDDIAYARMETVLPNATIVGPDGSPDPRVLPEYYWTREWLIVDSGDDLYIVKLFVADDDHRSPDYAAMSAWLDALRIVRS
jgi:hypothetical protein